MDSAYVFIWHTTADDHVIKQLREALVAHGLTVWDDARYLRGGDELWLEVAQAIETARSFMKLVASYDHQSGQFLLIMIGWDNRECWHHSITFHAQLIDGKVIIETDMIEDGLKPLLLEAGIPEEAFLSDRERDRLEAAQVALAGAGGD